MSWERSRSIPWSRIRQDGRVDPDVHKEQVFRELREEATEQETADGQQLAGTVAKGIPFSGMELLKNAAFGGCIGAVTGSVFGFMDGMRTAGESPVLKNASNMAKGKFILQGSSRSASIFGAFFGGFHVCKYGLRVLADPGEYTEVAVAGAITISGLMVKPVTRPSVPYAAMLVVMDAFQLVMRDMDKNK